MILTIPPAGPARRVLPHAWGQLRAVLLDLVYPPRCAGCGTRGTWFCACCMDQLVRSTGPVCSRCGEPVAARPPSSSSPLLCHRCQTQPLDLDGLRFVAYFEGPLRRAVHQLKYRGCRAVAPALGQLMADVYLMAPFPCDRLVPVPLHSQRLRERGYNQAALLAQAVGAVLDVPALPAALVRRRQTRSQVELGARERRENVRGAFAVPPTAVAAIQGQAIVLIDDVCTTGATLEACAVALRQAGARSVWGLTLGRER